MHATFWRVAKIANLGIGHPEFGKQTKAKEIRQASSAPILPVGSGLSGAEA
jgi:hypothetical protein